MSIGQLEGYVAGVLVCPETIPQAEWLPVVWGGDGVSAFGSDWEAGVAARTILDHYDRVSRIVDSAPEEYVTIYKTDENSGEMLWGPWVNGFERAMRLRADAWERIASCGEEEAAAALFMIDAMHAIDMGRSDLTEEAIDDLDRTASDLIPAFVRTLRAWSASRRPGGASAPGSNVVRSPSGTGTTQRSPGRPSYLPECPPCSLASRCWRLRCFGPTSPCGSGCLRSEAGSCRSSGTDRRLRSR